MADVELKALQRALKRLAVEQGPRARRNARLAVRAELRAISKWLDESYPAPPRRVKGGPRLSGEARAKWLLQNGWVPLTGKPAMFVEAVLAAGCTTRTVSRNEIYNGRVLPSKVPHAFVRAWTFLIWRAHGSKGLAKAVKSPSHRKAWLVAIALQGQATTAG